MISREINLRFKKYWYSQQACGVNELHWRGTTHSQVDLISGGLGVTAFVLGCDAVEEENQEVTVPLLVKAHGWVWAGSHCETLIDVPISPSEINRNTFKKRKDSKR